MSRDPHDSAVRANRPRTESASLVVPHLRVGMVRRLNANRRCDWRVAMGIAVHRAPPDILRAGFGAPAGPDPDCFPTGADSKKRRKHQTTAGERQRLDILSERHGPHVVAAMDDDLLGVEDNPRPDYRGDQPRRRHQRNRGMQLLPAHGVSPGGLMR